MSTRVNMNEVAFIDIQGFKVFNNNFILKEVYIHIVAGDLNYHALIDSPFQFHQLNKIEKRQINWLTKNYHGIRWDEGDIALSQFLDDMKAVLRGKIIIFKGVAKLKWLQIFFGSISIKEYINIEDLNCNFRLSEISENVDMCDYHKSTKKHNFVCAFRNVMNLRRWYFEEYIIA